MMQYIYSALSKATLLKISLGIYLRALCCVVISHVFAALPTNTSDCKSTEFVFVLLRSENG